eukprot:TRINITY_DN14666_c0_g1_i1.p1 TRINITY_DN14666_c0_g1~~TRINITY_DN14666_c0_g1_i1.p1  ORF type:complete len:222 (-),score=43.73 TRINITY_DN14666_c0_g1_i1:233-898(-)
MADETEEYVMERKCARCPKEGIKFQRCSRCKEVYYCSRDCQQRHWTVHKGECIPWDKRPQPPPEAVVVGYVECGTFEECRDFLIEHPELINKQIADEMFERGYMTLGTHPPEFGTRFIRNSQIISYLLDLRKVSHGQQDISLFFGRLLGPDTSFLANFNKEIYDTVKRVLGRYKEKKKEAKRKAKAEAAANAEKGADATPTPAPAPSVPEPMYKASDDQPE